jgi:hypothetical protein
MTAMTAVAAGIDPSLRRLGGGGGGRGEDSPAAAVVTNLVNCGTPPMLVRVMQLPPDCQGSADMLRILSRDGDGGDHPTTILPCTSHAVVMPGDLMLEGNLANDGGNGNVLSSLVEAHRMWNPRGGCRRSRWSSPMLGSMTATAHPSGSCPRQRWDSNRGWRRTPSTWGCPPRCRHCRRGPLPPRCCAKDAVVCLRLLAPPPAGWSSRGQSLAWRRTRGPGPPQSLPLQGGSCMLQARTRTGAGGDGRLPPHPTPTPLSASRWCPSAPTSSTCTCTQS